MSALSSPQGAAAPDAFAPRLALGAPPLVRQFNEAGILAAADIHVARRLCRLAGAVEESVMLAAALAVRAPRLGHVHVDLDTIRHTAAVDLEVPVDVEALPWPERDGWLERVRASPLVGTGEDADDASARPLRLVESWLYLDRYWSEERGLATVLERLSADEPVALAEEARSIVAAGLRRLFAREPPDSRQRLAAANAALRRFSVIAGGPGTGKTTTVARVAALFCEQAAGRGERPPLVALAAPTGKAAARLEEAVHAEAAKMDVSPEVQAQLLALESSTLHRLLGSRPDSHSRFRHDARQRLPHDVVIVDESSMVSLSLMARLIEALRPQARLVLVGDPGQLTSIEAGAVLGDIVGPAASGLRMTPPARARLATATGTPVVAAEPPPGTRIGDGIVLLDRVHRFGGTIAAVAAAVREGDADGAVEQLRRGAGDLTWVEADPASPEPADDPAPARSETAEVPAPLRQPALAAGCRLTLAARAGRGREALEILSGFRVLCAHRRGAHGVSTWTARMQSWLSAELPGLDPADPWYVGRPVLITENDYELGLFNGDIGVIVEDEHGIAAVFERRGELVRLSPARLSAPQTVYAMTIHKSQGSQFDVAAVVLPEPDSRILTRELLYTALTRARRRLIVTGSEASVRAAIERPVARASGLRRRLWEKPCTGTVLAG